ncbi:zinc finger protein 431 [Bactrocera dorsalis]|uniref:Zinc finger protein 431 n=1 Tax=Bactrocera dorsalis TaxID=27457 RepID=A0A6I9V4F0_BACDO|nr:zinc finger protein 431 [Bactrocera dorsalis]
MVRRRRLLSKEDGASVHTDSGISLSSPPDARTVHDGADEEDTQAAPKKKQARRRITNAKATKRGRRQSKDVLDAATTAAKKQKTSEATDLKACESDAADHTACGSNTGNTTPAIEHSQDAAGQSMHAEKTDKIAALEIGDAAETENTNAEKITSKELAVAADLAAAAVNAAFIVIPAADAAHDAIIAEDTTEKSVIILTTVSENSISVTDSAFSETDVTQSAGDLSELTHTATDCNDTANSLVDSASTAEATLTPAANKRSGKVFMRKVHVCHICSKQFRGNNDLRRHMLIHSDERPYKCEQCGNCYRQAVNLRNHINCAHTNQRQFACAQCPKMFAVKERLRLHMRLHSGEKPYACPVCEKRFARGGHLKQHVISHHKDSTKQYICEKCSTAFSTPSNLRAHMDRHENGPEHYCEICKEHFPNEPVLKAHINKLHYKLGQFDCEICKETIEDDALAKHMKTHTNVKTHVCEVCKSYFMQKSQYNVHMRMHTGERPYQCRICWQTYAYSSVLKLHIRKHTGEKPFQCLICTDVVAFSQLAHLKTHMKKIHKQTNPYMCEGCHQFFKIKAELQSHMQNCDSCNVDVEEENAKNNDSQTLSHLRFLMALLLKKISSQQKLQKLGYEKRLIDNVVVASLKLANRKACEDQSLSAIERMRRNVEEFLNWIVPAKAMETFRQEQQSVENILDKIVTMYMKHK